MSSFDFCKNISLDLVIDEKNDRIIEELEGERLSSQTIYTHIDSYSFCLQHYHSH